MGFGGQTYNFVKFKPGRASANLQFYQSQEKQSGALSLCLSDLTLSQHFTHCPLGENVEIISYYKLISYKFHPEAFMDVFCCVCLCESNNNTMYFTVKFQSDAKMLQETWSLHVSWKVKQTNGTCFTNRFVWVYCRFYFLRLYNLICTYKQSVRWSDLFACPLLDESLTYSQ